MSPKKAKSNQKKTITAYDRSFGIQKIFDLHYKKDYKIETLFAACNIFDRFIYKTGVAVFPKTKILGLATISTLMGAKLEEPISPSFNRMMMLLSDEE